MPHLPALSRQRSIYSTGLSGARSSIPFQASALKELARRKMSVEAWTYIDGGAGNEETIAANSAAFPVFPYNPG